MLPHEFHMPIPEERAAQARAAADIMGELVIGKYPFAGGTKPMVAGRAEALLNRTWRPALSVVGADGLPAIANAGNVLRPLTSLKLSLRIPPTLDGERATKGLSICSKRIRRMASVRRSDQGATGWNAPTTAPYLSRARSGVAGALRTAGRAMARAHHSVHGDAGCIFLLRSSSSRACWARFECARAERILHVPYAKKLTACRGLVAHVARRDRTTPPQESRTTSRRLRENVRIRAAMSASKTGRGGASSRAIPVMCAVPSQHQSRSTWMSVRAPTSARSRIRQA
jgi:hypothetical protein